MTSETAIHQRNLESNILFIQQQHAATLKALHAEIAKLQKKCSDATYQLTLQMPDLEKEQKEHALKQHSEELTRLRKKHDDVMEKAHKKDRQIKLLEQQYKAQEKKYCDDLKNKTLAINKLQADLDSKSNNIAYLTTELHKLKLKQSRKVSANSRSSSESGELSYDPSPPKLGMPKVRHFRRIDSSDIHGKIKSHMVESGYHGGVRGTATLSRLSGIPDPSPFLKRESIDSGMNIDICLRTANPLPPIAGKDVLDDISTPDYDILFHSSCTSQTNLVSEQTVPEVETLAVDQLSVTGLPWQPTAHGSKSSELH